MQIIPKNSKFRFEQTYSVFYFPIANKIVTTVTIFYYLRRVDKQE